VGRQGCMLGRCNICVMSSDNVSPFRKTRSNVSALRMSDMKKIKTKLVTFVTDNVLLVSIVGSTNLLARMLQDKER
jgi:hypothetical protein